MMFSDYKSNVTLVVPKTGLFQNMHQALNVNQNNNNETMAKII